ncbi:MAG: Gfo/Idh/MocA family oxidoreductase [Candidatus Rokubacteria bacterium]|nr:Gfo/Idh/MocA family oxidoreductase [Candidatus Rokubacteria bacterium]
MHLAARGYRVPAAWRRRREEAGGGALIDGGIHYVNLLRQCGGEVAAVYALRPPQTITEMEGEDSVSLLARLRSGAVGVLVNSIGTPGIARTQCSSVSGSEGTLFIDNRGRFLLLRARRGRRFRVFLRDSRGHGAMLREFVAAIRDRRQPATTGEEGRRDLAVVLAAYRSLALGRPVELSAPDPRPGGFT